MRKRSRARELSLQMLYQFDITGELSRSLMDNFWAVTMESKAEDSVVEFTNSLVAGVMEKLEEVDKEISNYAINWQLKRMAVVDRNILRLGVYELMFCPQIPPKVSINEAVELAKKYSSIKAAKFVNGILDKVKTDIKK